MNSINFLIRYDGKTETYTCIDEYRDGLVLLTGSDTLNLKQLEGINRLGFVPNLTHKNRMENLLKHFPKFKYNDFMFVGEGTCAEETVQRFRNLHSGGEINIDKSGRCYEYLETDTGGHSTFYEIPCEEALRRMDGDNGNKITTERKVRDGQRSNVKSETSNIKTGKAAF